MAVAKHSATGVPKALLSTQLYDGLKTTAQIILPAVGVAYAAIATIWGIGGHNKEVLGTIAALETLIGALLGISKASFQKSGGDGVVNADGKVVLHDAASLNKDVVVLTQSTSSPNTTSNLSQ